jgi:type 1 glutamine amidotransferase
MMLVQPAAICLYPSLIALIAPKATPPPRVRGVEGFPCAVSLSNGIGEVADPADAGEGGLVRRSLGEGGGGPSVPITGACPLNRIWPNLVITMIMKYIASMILAFVSLCGLSQTSTAKSWEERAAERFQKNPLNDEQREKIRSAIPDKPLAKPKKSRKILVISRCESFIHTSIPHGKYMLEQLGKKTGAFEAVFNDNYDAFSKENLKQFDGIVFNNTTDLKFSEEQEAAIMDFINGGKGIIGIHAATDNFKKWHEGLCMMGGVFNGHPWNAGGNWAFQLDDAKNPVNQVFGGKGFWHTDEIYQYKPDSYQGPEKLRILVSLDMDKEANQKPLTKAKKNAVSVEEAKQRHIPVSWIRDFGKGRLFYTNFGHREDTNWNPKINQHILDGIQFALGDLEADATPTAEMKDLIIAKAPDQPDNK